MSKLSPTQTGWVAAELLHTLASYAAILTALYLGYAWWDGALAIVIFATIKEPFVDPYIEKNAPFFWNGAIDYAFYLLGIGLTVLFLFLTHHF